MKCREALTCAWLGHSFWKLSDFTESVVWIFPCKTIAWDLKAPGEQEYVSRKLTEQLDKELLCYPKFRGEVPQICATLCVARGSWRTGMYLTLVSFRLPKASIVPGRCIPDFLVFPPVSPGSEPGPHFYSLESFSEILFFQENCPLLKWWPVTRSEGEKVIVAIKWVKGGS